MTIKHYIGVWLPGIRDDATVKAGTGAINFSDHQVSDSGDVVKQVLQGLGPGSYEVDCLAEEGAQSVRANTLPVVIPPKYFEYFSTDPASFARDFSEIGLNPIDQDFAVQAVYGLKQDMASSSQSHVFHRVNVKEQDSASGYRLEVRTDIEGVSLQIGNNSGTSLGSTDFPTNGFTKSTVCDFRYRAQGGSLSSWLNKGDLDTATYDDSAIDPINQLVYSDSEMRLIALRIVTPAPDDNTILAWPGYTYPVPVPASYGPKTSYDGVAVNWDASAGWVNLELGSWSATGLPAGLGINPDTGIVSGTPTTLQTASTSIIYTQNGVQYSDSFTWTIAEVPPAPEGGNRGGLNLNLDLML